MQMWIQIFFPPLLGNSLILFLLIPNGFLLGGISLYLVISHSFCFLFFSFLLFCLFRFISCFVSFRVSFRFVFCFVSCFVSFRVRFVSFRFVSSHLVSFRFVSSRFCFFSKVYLLGYLEGNAVFGPDGEVYNIYYFYLFFNQFTVVWYNY
jgi:hypothetical protein